jgi:hypothetical protein
MFLNIAVSFCKITVSMMSLESPYRCLGVMEHLKKSSRYLQDLSIEFLFAVVEYNISCVRLQF